MITKIVPQGCLSILADFLFLPIMWSCVMFRQAPQWTHFWNNKKLDPALAKGLDNGMCIRYFGDKDKKDRGFIRFHLPGFLGGWTDFAVVFPSKDCDWYIGWTDGETFFGYSQIRRRKGKSVKVLLGRGPVTFFALNSKGEQIPLKVGGMGNLKRPSKYRWIPLR